MIPIKSGLTGLAQTSRGGKLNHRQMGTPMTRYGQIGWRMAAVVAFVGTAALAVTLTRAPIRPDAALSSKVPDPCATSGLEAWLGLGAEGRPHWECRRHNGDRRTKARAGPTTRWSSPTSRTARAASTATRRCPLTPDSRATGSQIGSAAIRDTSVRPKPVMLAPGATAHSVLGVVVTGGTQPVGCAQVTAEELRVTLPRQGRPALVPVRHTGVLAEGAPIAERAGYPGPAGCPRLRHDALTRPRQ